MVQQGQFLERPTLIPVGDLVLEGLSHRGARRPGVLILPPMPDEGGMDHVVANELAWATAQNGFPSLRFNFRGVGASQGRRGEDPLADAEAALAVLRENTQAAGCLVATLGSSAKVGLQLVDRHPGLVGLVLVSPVAIDPADLTRLTLPVWAIVPEDDTRMGRAALAAALTSAQGRLEVIPATGRTYTRHLPEVGRALVRMLQELGT